MADFAFVVDVTALMTALYTKLQDKGLFINEMHNLEKAFVVTLLFFSRQLESNNHTHIQTLIEDTIKQ